jgi:hypothetical protein
MRRSTWSFCHGERGAPRMTGVLEPIEVPASRAVIQGGLFDKVVVGERIHIFAAEFMGQQKAVNVSLYKGTRDCVGEVVQPVAFATMRLDRKSQCSRTFPDLLDFVVHHPIRFVQQ